MRTRVSAALTAATLMASLLLVGGTASAAGGTSNPASVWVVHGIKNATVDVCVDGSEVRSRFNFKNRFLAELPAGTYNVKVRAAKAGECTGDLVTRASVEVAAGGNYTAIAGRRADGTPKLFAFANDVSKTDDGRARVTVRHTAAAPPVDVRVKQQVLLEDVPNGAEATLEVPEGQYRVNVALPNTDVVVIGPRWFDLQEGTAYQVHAVGGPKSGYVFIALGQAVGTA